MTGETSTEQAIRTADVLDGRAPWHSGVLVLAAYHLRALAAERNAAIARAEAAEAQLEQAREALADLIGAADRMAMAMNSGMADESLRRAQAALKALEAST